jgi:hypothetical protein
MIERGAEISRWAGGAHRKGCADGDDNASGDGSGTLDFTAIAPVVASSGRQERSAKGKFFNAGNRKQRQAG